MRVEKGHERIERHIQRNITTNSLLLIIISLVSYFN